MIFDILAKVLIFLAFFGFAYRRVLTYLHAFQQEEYDARRFLAWIRQHKVFDKKLSGILVVIAGIHFLSPPAFILQFLIFAGFAVFAYLEKDPRQRSKKKLAVTDRAKRIIAVTLILTLIPALLCVAFIPAQAAVWLLLVQLIPLFLVLGNAVLSPYENGLQKRFWNEASAKIKELDPVIIAITGSYGKTSVKHILGHILSNHAPTLMTPGSVNTPMGIARIIREELTAEHRYMIVEMGAYGPGSIERLCSLTPPNHGIITAIGHAHYERFKSLNTVAEAKFELAKSVINKEGTVIAHEKTFRFEASEAVKNEFPDSFKICGHSKSDLFDFSIYDVNQTFQGLEFFVSENDDSQLLAAPLFGIHHVDNIAMAYAMARALGLEPAGIISALKSLPQIKHRLEVKKNNRGAIVIDDAYNSNPQGFYSALDLLAFLGKKKRKILITPGMIELGRAHDEIHRQVGQYAAERCDLCLLIQEPRIQSFSEGFEENAENASIIRMENFEEAQKWLADNLTENDIVLLENDLPDIYERIPRL